MTVREGVLKYQPLIYVLASIRFQPWMLLPSKIPEIQDRLRESFPVVNQIQVGQTPFQGSADIGGLQTAAWAFHRFDRKIGCQISPDQIVVHCVEYESFGRFSEIVRVVVDSVIQHARHLDAVSMGIRYLDIIQARENESLTDYVPKELLPYEVNLQGMKVFGGHTQSTYETSAGLLQARFWTGKNFMTVPDDLVPIYVLTKDLSQHVAFPLTALAEGQGILDTDSIWNAKTPVRMDGESAMGKLSELHLHANNFFRTVCSEHAFRVWQGEA